MSNNANVSSDYCAHTYTRSLMLMLIKRFILRMLMLSMFISHTASDNYPNNETSLPRRPLNSSQESFDRFIEENTLHLNVDLSKCPSEQSTSAQKSPKSPNTPKSPLTPKSPMYAHERWSEPDIMDYQAVSKQREKGYPVIEGPGGRRLTCPGPGNLPNPCHLDSTAVNENGLLEEFSGMDIKYDEDGHVNYYSDTSSDDGIRVIIHTPS